MPLRIKVRENGPYALDVTTADFILVDHNDQPIPIPPLKPGKTNVTLCRCGLSSRKPFCDSTHSRVGWKGVNEDQTEPAASPPESPKAG
jgi:CDGSH-type Zn-finger protein